jgi:hypothetical protein
MVGETHISLSVRLFPSSGSGERFYAIRNSNMRFVQMVALCDVIVLADSFGVSSLPLKFSLVI